MPRMTPAEAEALFQRQPIILGRMAFFRLLADLGFEGMGQGVPPADKRGKVGTRKRWFRFVNIHVEPGTLLRKAIQSAGDVESQKEAKRLIAQGGVKVNGAAITDTEFVLQNGGPYQVRIGGKRVLEVEVMDEQA